MGCGASSADYLDGPSMSGSKKQARRASLDLEDTPTIWIGNIPALMGSIDEAGRVEARPVNEQEISEAFRAYGDILNVSLRRKGDEFDERSWALLTFRAVDSACRALKGSTIVLDSAFEDVRLVVKKARVGDQLNTSLDTGGALSLVAAQHATTVRRWSLKQKQEEELEEQYMEFQSQKEKAEARSKRQKFRRIQTAEIDELGAEVAMEEDLLQLSAEAAMQAAGEEQADGSSSEDEIEEDVPVIRVTRRRPGAGTPLEKCISAPAVNGKLSSYTERRPRRASSKDLRGIVEETEPDLAERGQARRRSTTTANAEMLREDIDRVALWNTAWVGGIPAGFLEGDEAELKVLRLLKECGAVLQVTVRKKEDSTSGVFRSWAFVTFAEARSVSVAMRAGVRVAAPYDTQLEINPADVEGELAKNSTGALGEKWSEQQAKVREAEQSYDFPRRRRSTRMSQTSDTSDRAGQGLSPVTLAPRRSSLREAMNHSADLVQRSRSGSLGERDFVNQSDTAPRGRVRSGSLGERDFLSDTAPRRSSLQDALANTRLTQTSDERAEGLSPLRQSSLKAQDDLRAKVEIRRSTLKSHRSSPLN